MHYFHRCGACFKAFTLACVLSAGHSVCSRHDQHGEHCSSGPCRHLADVTVVAEEAVPVSFVDWLAGESPIEHVQELFEASNSEYDVVQWLLIAAKEGGEGIASGNEEEEDEHAGHGHRRLAQAATVEEDPHAGHDHGDHSEEEHSEEEHSEEEHSEEEHSEEEDHAGHDHGDHSEEEHDSAGGAVVLRAVDIQTRAEAMNMTSAQVLASAMQFITACTVDSNCVLESAEEEEEEGHEGKDEGMRLGLKSGLAVAFLAMTVIASFIPFLFKRSEHFQGILSCLNVFSGAVFLTVGLTHLLPHVYEFQELSMPGETYPVGLTTVAMGFLLILFVEQILFDAHGPHKPVAAKAIDTTDYKLLDRTLSVGLVYQDPLITELAVTVHAVLECMVMGLAGSRHDILLLFAAITSHKVFSTISLATRFIRLGASPSLLFALMLPYHLLAPLAVIAGALIGSEDFTVSLVLTGLATGTFLYIGAFEVLCEEFAEHEDTEEEVALKGSDSVNAKVSASKWMPGKRIKFLIFLIGMGAILAITAALPKDAHNH